MAGEGIQKTKDKRLNKKLYGISILIGITVVIIWLANVICVILSGWICGDLPTLKCEDFFSIMCDKIPTLIVHGLSLFISSFAISMFLGRKLGSNDITEEIYKYKISNQKSTDEIIKVKTTYKYKIPGLPFTDGFIIFLLLVGIIYYALTPPPTKDKDFLSFAITQAFMLVFSAHLILKSMR